MKRRKIFFIHSTFYPTVLEDLRILRKHFKVKRLIYKGIRKYPHMIFKIISGVAWSNIVVAWCGDAYLLMVLPIVKLLGKKLYVFLASYETANMKELNYGAMVKLVPRWRVKLILGTADKLIGASLFHKKSVEKYVRKKDKVVQINFAINTEKVEPHYEKENMVYFVIGGSGVTKEKRQAQILQVIEIAKRLREVKFVVIGDVSSIDMEYIKKIASPNVIFTGFISEDDVAKWRREAKVYLRPIPYDGGSITLLEAMYSECIPVGTKILKDTIEDTGYYMEWGDIEGGVKAIRRAIEDKKKGKKAKERIVKYYSMKRREEELIKLIINENTLDR